MALTRKLLKGMGLTEEQVDTIIEAHTDTVDGLKDDIKKYKGDAEKLAEVQKELDDLKAAGDGGWKEKHDTVKKELDDYKAEQAKKETRAAKEAAYRELLKEAGVSEKRIDVVLRASQIDEVELLEDGKVKDADKHTESIKKDWADFIVTKKKEGAPTKTPPANGGGGAMTKEEIMKIPDRAERRAAIAKNMSLFEKGE